MAKVSEFAHNLYLSIPISNPSSATTTINAQFQQQLSQQTFIEKADDWRVTVVRFSLPISALPYFNSSASVYKIALSWRGVTYQQTISVPSYSAGAGQSANVYYIQVSELLCSS